MALPRSRVILQGRLRFKHLVLADVLARTGNLHLAADELNMTQPAASKMLQDLEMMLGARLFDRHARGMMCTDIGRFVAEQARAMLGETERFLDTLETLKRGGYGAISVGAIMATAPGILPKAIVEMKRRRPLMTIHLMADTSDRLLAALEQKELDFVIGRFTETRQYSLFHIAPLANEELWIFAARGHDFASGDMSANLAALAEMPWILQPTTSPMRQLLDRFFAEHGLRTPHNLVETTSIFGTLELVRSAGMIAVLPRSIVEEPIARGDYVRLPVEITNPLDGYGIITRISDPPSAAAAEFIDILRGTTEALAAS